jgi:hypothetical protein
MLLSPPASVKGLHSLFESALEEVPSIEIKLHSLQSGEDTSECSQANHACILPRESRPDRKT